MTKAICKQLSGTVLSASIQSELQIEIQSLKTKHVEPSLAVIIVGNDPASEIYVSHKQRACEKVGIRSVKHIMPATISQQELIVLINHLNKDIGISGILCQLPLPEHLDEKVIISAINPNKDVDCFHPLNFGLLASGMPRFMPCTPLGVLQILKRNSVSTKGKHVVVVGRSNIVGRPLSILLSASGQDATVTLCHRWTINLAKICNEADILIVAVGIPKFITDEYIKPGAVVIDVGINRISDPTCTKGFRLVGDVDFDAVSKVAEAITPVPGGVGPMTISMLLLNTINAARFQAELPAFELGQVC